MNAWPCHQRVRQKTPSPERLELKAGAHRSISYPDSLLDQRWEVIGDGNGKGWGALGKGSIGFLGSDTIENLAAGRHFIGGRGGP